MVGQVVCENPPELLVVHAERHCERRVDPHIFSDKQPLDLPSAGSAFKRPANGYAAAMIDAAGLKGFAVGGAMVSTKHAGFIVNAGGATYDDVRELIEEVRRRVLSREGVLLEPEIKIIAPDW